MNDISNQQQLNGKKAGKHVKKGSIGGDVLAEKFGNLLLDDDDKQQQNLLSDQGEAKKARGPKLDENVMVKICDMGNGCWTHHHFTPEIQTR